MTTKVLPYGFVLETFEDQCPYTVDEETGEEIRLPDRCTRVKHGLIPFAIIEPWDSERPLPDQAFIEMWFASLSRELRRMGLTDDESE